MSSSLICLYITLSAILLCNLVTCEVMPIPGDCTRYQVCDYSGCFVFNCGVGTEFNPKILVCDYPLQDRSYCGNRANVGNLGLLGGNNPAGNAYPANNVY